MNLQERALLVEFLDELVAARSAPKDLEAEVLIRGACERQPDACYLLAQRALQLQLALERLQAGLERPQSSRRGVPAALPDSTRARRLTRAYVASPGALVSPPPWRRGAEPEPRAEPCARGEIGDGAAAAAPALAPPFLVQRVEILQGGVRGASPPDRAPEPIVLNDPGDETSEDERGDAGWYDGGDGGDFA